MPPTKTLTTLLWRRFSLAAFLLVILIILFRLPSRTVELEGFEILPIEGQWKDIRSVLAMKPLVNKIQAQRAILEQTYPPRYSRFGLKQRRAAEDEAATHVQPILFFARDTSEEPSITSKELLQSFQNIALLEKEDGLQLKRKPKHEARRASGA